MIMRTPPPGHKALLFFEKDNLVKDVQNWPGFIATKTGILEQGAMGAMVCPPLVSEPSCACCINIM